MILYHGTTRRRAERICSEGFRPRKPSRRVWFAEARGYALGRAKTQARRAHDRPVVLTCEVDVHALRKRLGPRRVVHRGQVIAIDAPLPVSVLRSHPGLDSPSTPGELAAWVNRLLRLKPHKGVSPKHPGIQRLSRWVANRVQHHGTLGTTPGELLPMARQWVPEYFDGVEVDLERMHARLPVRSIEVTADLGALDAKRHEQENKAVDLLDSSAPRRRVRGLELLASLKDEDLFDWCTMLLDDESRSVRVAALRTMRACEHGDASVIEPLAGSADNLVRGAAVAALARHAGRRRAFWVRRGLKDPQACVRTETARVLSELDPQKHHRLFELALYDPNPDVARVARRLTEGRGFRKWPV